MAHPPHHVRIARIKRAIEEDDDSQLSDEDKKMYAEFLALFSLLMNPRNTTGAIIRVLKSEHGLLERTAYSRIKDAKFIFDDMFAPDKSMEKMRALRRAERAAQLAEKQKYSDGLVSANNQIIKLLALDKEETPGAIDPTQMQPSQYKLVASKDARRVLNGLLDSGTVDIGKMMLEAGSIPEAVVIDGKGDEEEEELEEDDDPLK